MHFEGTECRYLLPRQAEPCVSSQGEHTKRSARKVTSHRRRPIERVTNGLFREAECVPKCLTSLATPRVPTWGGAQLCTAQTGSDALNETGLCDPLGEP